jgi:tetratricopeptide (TPR) repeat protein
MCFIERLWNRIAPDKMDFAEGLSEEARTIEPYALLFQSPPLARPNVPENAEKPRIEKRGRSQFLHDHCIAKGERWRLVDPFDEAVEKEWLRVELDVSSEKCEGKLGNALMVRAYAVTSSKHRIEVNATYGGEPYKLCLASPGKTPEEEYYFCLLRVGGDVFQLHLVKQGDAEPKLKQDKDAVRRESIFVALVRNYERNPTTENWNKVVAQREKYGDIAYVYGLLRPDEDIRVGDVVARVATEHQVCVTKDPDASGGTILGWGVVANYETTLGFHAELPRPELKNPHGRPANFVAVATQGVVAVMMTGGCVVGQWLVASGKGDGLAVIDSGCADGERRRLGKVQSVGDGCVFLEVNFENNVLRPDKALEMPASAKKEEKSKACLRNGDRLKQQEGGLSEAIKAYKRGLYDESSKYTRTLLYCAISACYLLLERFEKAKKFAKWATRLCAVHSEGFFLLAQAYYSLKVPQKAQMSIDRAMAMCPDREDYADLMNKKIQVAWHDHLLGGDDRNDLKPEIWAKINESIMRDRLQEGELERVRELLAGPDAEKLLERCGRNDYGRKLVKMERLVNAGKYREAIEYGESLAKEGHAGVIYNLAALYEKGCGVEKDPGRAAELLWMAAKAKDDGPSETRKLGVAEAKGSLAERFDNLNVLR